MMPQLSGFDVAAMLKSNPQTEGIPIVILSILADADRGLRLGVDHYLTKPVSEEDLSRVVDALITHRPSPRRVLVVDDDEPAASDISRLLASKGYHVVGACRGEECLREARRNGVEMIIVESAVGDQAGLIRAIRYEKDLEHVLVVQLTEETPGSRPSDPS